MAKKFLIYDGRANPNDGTDEAVVLTVSNSLSEARRDARDYGQCHIWSYDATADGELIHEEYVEEAGSF